MFRHPPSNALGLFPENLLLATGTAPDLGLKVWLALQPSILRLPPSVLAVICTTLREEGTWDGMRALSSLSRTCSYLAEHALDALWHALPSIVPLLRTLPEDLCCFNPEIRNQDGITIVPATVSFLRVPVPEDFTRFLAYCWRVKELFAPVCGTLLYERYVYWKPQIQPSVWHGLENFAPQPLLPNLRVLQHLEVLVPSTFDHLYTEPADLFIGPRVTAVSLTLRPERVPHILSILGPSVTFLGLKAVTEPLSTFPLDPASKPPYNPPTLLAHHLPSLSTLTSLKLGGVYLSPDALVQLGRLPRLRTLAVSARCADLLWDAPHGHRGALFPALTHLTLRTNSFLWARIVLETVASPALEQFAVLSADGPALPLAFRALCEALAEGPWRGALRAICVVSGRKDDVRTPVVAYEWFNTLSPLLGLPALKSLEVYGRCKVLLGEGTSVETMRAAWPGLECLKIET